MIVGDLAGHHTFTGPTRQMEVVVALRVLDRNH